MIVFVRLVLTALQVVLSFHQLRNAASSSEFYLAIFVLSVGKIVMSHKVIVEPPWGRAQRPISAGGGLFVQECVLHLPLVAISRHHRE